MKHETMDYREFEMRVDPSDENPQEMKKIVLTVGG